MGFFCAFPQYSGDAVVGLRRDTRRERPQIGWRCLHCHGNGGKGQHRAVIFAVAERQRVLARDTESVDEVRDARRLCLPVQAQLLITSILQTGDLVPHLRQRMRHRIVCRENRCLRDRRVRIARKEVVGRRDFEIGHRKRQKVRGRVQEKLPRFPFKLAAKLFMRHIGFEHLPHERRGHCAVIDPFSRKAAVRQAAQPRGRAVKQDVCSRARDHAVHRQRQRGGRQKCQTPSGAQHREISRRAKGGKGGAVFRADGFPVDGQRSVPIKKSNFLFFHFLKVPFPKVHTETTAPPYIEKGRQSARSMI